MNRIYRLPLSLLFSLLFLGVLIFAPEAKAQVATTTMLTVNPTCPGNGCVSTLTATVTAGGSPVHPGLVVFCDKGLADCQNGAPIGRAQLLADGTATIRLALTPGPHTLRAIFHGTTGYSTSTSASQSASIAGSTAQRSVYNSGSYSTAKDGGFYFNTTYLSSNYVPATGTLSYIDASRGNAVLTSPAVVPYPGIQPEFFYVTGDPQSVAQIPASLLLSAVGAITGDFNNDGFQDVILLGGNTGLNVLFGNGHGTFTAGPAPKGTTGAHGSLLVGDFNSDGKLDIAIPDAVNKTIYIGLGNGDGTFTAAASTTLTDSPQFLAICDLNNDGIPDLVAVSSAAGSGGAIDILIGQGDGTFNSKTPLTFNSDVLATVAVADFNVDGNQDLVFFDQTLQALTILKGNGDGTFGTAPVASLPFPGGNGINILTGGIGGDSVPDIVFVAQFGTTTFLGKGDFSFTGGALNNGYAAPFAVGDFEADGELSEAALQGNEYLLIYGSPLDYSVGTEIAYPVQGVTPLLATADFDGDGIPDFLVVNAASVANPPGYGYPLTPTFLGHLANTETVPSVKTIFFDPGYHTILDSYSGDAYHDPFLTAGTTIYSYGIDYYSSFTGATGLTFNGSASLKNGAIQLAPTGQFQAGSFFTSSRVDLSGQVTGIFDFQIPAGNADGFAYVFQANGPDAIGSSGGGLGYGNPPGGSGASITNSVAVAFDLHNNQGEGNNSVRIEYNGVTSPAGAIDLTPSGIDLHSGHRFQVTIVTAPGGGITGLNLTITDTQTKKTFYHPYQLPIEALLTGNMGYIGFTAGTGESTSAPIIYDWVANQGIGQTIPTAPLTPYYSNGFAGATGLLFNGGSAISGSALELTNGTPFKATSTYAARQVGAYNTTFNTDFDFTVGDGSGDGFTFVLQDHSTTVVGSTGGGLGYAVDYLSPAPPSYAIIPNSLAIKFDLHNNQGEGPNSTGLYLNGASPTTPSVDLSSSGINLHSGHTFHARITRTGTNQFTLTITDLTVYKVFQTTFTVANPSVLQEGAVYAGFTAGTGATPSTIKILNWTFTE